MPETATNERIERVAVWLFNRIKEERLVWAADRVPDEDWVDLEPYLKEAWIAEAVKFMAETGLG